MSIKPLEIVLVPAVDIPTDIKVPLVIMDELVELAVSAVEMVLGGVGGSVATVMLLKLVGLKDTIGVEVAYVEAGIVSEVVNVLVADVEA